LQKSISLSFFRSSNSPPLFFFSKTRSWTSAFPLLAVTHLFCHLKAFFFVNLIVLHYPFFRGSLPQSLSSRGYFPLFFGTISPFFFLVPTKSLFLLVRSLSFPLFSPSSPREPSVSSVCREGTVPDLLHPQHLTPTPVNHFPPPPLPSVLLIYAPQRTVPWSLLSKSFRSTFSRTMLFVRTPQTSFGLLTVASSFWFWYSFLFRHAACAVFLAAFLPWLFCKKSLSPPPSKFLFFLFVCFLGLLSPF